MLEQLRANLAFAQVKLSRHVVGLLSAAFLCIGCALLAWSYRQPTSWSGGVAQNLGTEFFGGVILLIAFMTVEKRVRRRQGISYAHLSARLRGARVHFRLLTTFSYLFADPTDVESHVRVDDLAKCRTQLETVMEGNPAFRVQILVLSPLSVAAQQRALDRSDVDVIKLLWQNIRHLTALQKRFGSLQVEVRVYSSLPRMSLIQVDDHLSVSFFERDTSISAANRSELTADQPVARFFTTAFEQLWTDKHTTPLPQFLSSLNEDDVRQHLAAGAIRPQKAGVS